MSYASIQDRMKKAGRADRDEKSYMLCCGYWSLRTCEAFEAHLKRLYIAIHVKKQDPKDALRREPYWSHGGGSTERRF